MTSSFTLAFYRAIQSYADEHPDETPAALADALAAGLTETQLRDLAADRIAAAVADHRRQQAREAEERAKLAAARQDREEMQAEVIREHAEYAAQVAAEKREAMEQATSEDAFRRMYESPVAEIAELDQEDVRREVGYRYREWCGDRFDEWFDRAQREVVASWQGTPGWRHYDTPEYRLVDTFYPGGFTRFHTDKMIADWAARIRLEVTTELLGTSFALGNGTEVGWGEATVDQHRQYVQMLAGLATGTMQTASRHQAAIRMCEEAEVDCLNDLPGSELNAGPTRGALPP
jgi:hypothetical protein